MHTAQSEDRAERSVRLLGRDNFGNTREIDRIARNFPRRLVVGVPKPSRPGVPPGNEPTGLDFRHDPGDFVAGLGRRLDRGIRKREEAAFHSQTLRHLHAQFHPALGHFRHRERAPRIRHFPSREPEDYDPRSGGTLSE